MFNHERYAQAPNDHQQGHVFLYSKSVETTQCSISQVIVYRARARLNNVLNRVFSYKCED